MLNVCRACDFGITTFDVFLCTPWLGYVSETKEEAQWHERSYLMELADFLEEKVYRTYVLTGPLLSAAEQVEKVHN